MKTEEQIKKRIEEVEWYLKNVNQDPIVLAKLEILKWILTQ